MQLRNERWPCSFPVVFEARGTAWRSRIVNISRSGARMNPGHCLPAGTRITLRLGGMPLEGEIRWLRDGIAGVEFLQLLSPRQVQSIRTGAPGIGHGLREMT